MNTSKAIEWLIFFANLMLGCLLLKKLKKINESCSLSKAARMSFVTTHLRFVTTHGNFSKDRSQWRTHGYSIDLIIKLTVKNKMSL